MSKTTVLSRGLLVSTLSMALTACMNMQAPQPVIKSDIPQNFTQTETGSSIAIQGYKQFFADARLLHEPYRVCRRLNILRDYSDEKTNLYPRN